MMKRPKGELASEQGRWRHPLVGRKRMHQLTRLGVVPLGTVANFADREKGTRSEALGASAPVKV